MKKRGFRILPKSMKTKHDWGDKVPVSGIYECSICGNYEAFKKGENFSECQDCINANRKEENKWFATNEFTYFLSKNINMEFEKIQGLSITIADAITEYAGTIGFFLLHVLWFSIWVLANTGAFGPRYVLDPYPFGLLTMIVSLEAIFLSTFILMSQNVAAKKSELRSEHEYQVNLETEKNVAEILAMIKDIRKENSIRTEHIEEIKETVEEISEHIDLDEGQKEEDKTEAQEEKEEKQEFEEHEKLLDEIGIDIVPESAPPAILKEEEIISDDKKEKEEPAEKKKSVRRKTGAQKKKKGIKKRSKTKKSGPTPAKRLSKTSKQKRKK